MKNFIIKSIFGGILISLGSFCYVSTGMEIIGAILFAFGLISVVLTQSNLFTGKSGFFINKKEFYDLFIMLILNIIGCVIIGFIAKEYIKTDTIVIKRLSSEIYNIFLMSICTGMIMTISVKYAKENNWLPLLFGVPTFIICGMPHCIADAFYYSVYFWGAEPFNTSVLLVWLYSIIGNFIGCILPTKLFDIY